MFERGRTKILKELDVLEMIKQRKLVTAAFIGLLSVNQKAFAKKIAEPLLSQNTDDSDKED